MQIIGQKIKALRESRGFSQEYLAEMLQLSQSEFSKMENNQVKIDIDKLYKIAEVLQVPLQELLPENGNTYNVLNNKTINGFIHYQYVDPRLIEQYEKRIALLEKLLQEKEAQLRTRKG